MPWRQLVDTSRTVFRIKQENGQEGLDVCSCSRFLGSAIGCSLGQQGSGYTALFWAVPAGPASRLSCPCMGDSQAPSTRGPRWGLPQEGAEPPRSRSESPPLSPPCRPASVDLREDLAPQRPPLPPPGPTEDLISTDAGAGPLRAAFSLPPKGGSIPFPICRWTSNGFGCTATPTAEGPGPVLGRLPLASGVCRPLFPSTFPTAGAGTRRY